VIGKQLAGQKIKRNIVEHKLWKITMEVKFPHIWLIGMMPAKKKG
jgi:hypothetical protein